MELRYPRYLVAKRGLYWRVFLRGVPNAPEVIQITEATYVFDAMDHARTLLGLPPRRFVVEVLE